MAYGTWAVFLVVSLAAVLTPGPAMLAILGHALARDQRSMAPIVLGNACGAVVMIGASVAGLSALLAAVPHGLAVLKWTGAAFLFWIGIQTWRRDAQPRPSAAVAVAPSRSGRGFVRGLLIAFSNPKALLFYGAVLPQFVEPGQPTLPQFVIMAGTFVSLELLVTTGVTVAAAALSPILQGAVAVRRVSRAGGAIMIGAAAMVALASVHR